jgi:hypothetical protein
MADLRTTPPPPETPAPPPPHRGWRGPLIVLVLLLAVGMAVVVVWVVASGDAGVSLEEPPPPEDGVPASVEQEVLAAWRGYGEALDQVNREMPDPDDPLLARHATGETLESVRAAAARNRDEGIVTARPPDSVAQQWAEVISVDGDTAQIRSCEVDDRLVLNAETGETLTPPHVSTLLVEATLVREDGAWKVARGGVVEEWDGIAGCAFEHL